MAKPQYHRKETDGHQARKRFGQNFLSDQSVIERIVNSVHHQDGDALVEIGPGLGALTKPLIEEVKQLTVLEIDKDLAKELPFRTGYPEGLTIVEGDALKFDFRQLAERMGKPLRVVGNLPYNISTPLIFHLLSMNGVIQDMHFMLQKEVVDRMVAEPNTPEYGRLSVMVQYYCQAHFLFEVPPTAFIPAPKVTSAVFRLRPYTEKPITAKDEKAFAHLVLNAFNMRRKTLRSSLKGKVSEEVFEALGINPMARPENLSVADFVKLSDAIGE